MDKKTLLFFFTNLDEILTMNRKWTISNGHYLDILSNGRYFSCTIMNGIILLIWMVKPMYNLDQSYLSLLFVTI